MNAAISIDFETYYSKKNRYTLKTSIAEQYCKHPLFDAYLVSVSDGKTMWAGSPKDLNWSALEGKIWLSHNAYFDRTVYERLVELGKVPLVKFADWICTANLTSFLCNRRSLDESVEHLLKIKLSKVARASADNKKWPQDFSPEEQKQMIEYAQRDAYYCWLLWDKFSDRWPEHERKLSALTINQGRRGVQINTDLLDQYLVQVHEMKLNTEKLLPWLNDDESEEWEDYDVKPTATKCIAEACRRAGIPCPPVKSREGEEAYAEWEKTYSAANLWIPALSSWRSVNKMYGTLQTMKSRIRDDGTMPFGLKYFGAHTGRWSGDAKINFQNFRKKPVLCDQNGLMETDEKRVEAALKEKKKTKAWPSWVRYSIDMRHLIIPRPGKKMVVYDLSQIEPRALAWLDGDTQLLDLVRQGMSIYQAHAQTALGWSGSNLKEEDEGLYAEAKARVLALGYGAGWEKFIEMAALYTGLDLTENDPEWIEIPDPITGETKKVSGYGQRAKKIVAEFRLQNPKISGDNGIWRQLENAFKRSIGGDFTVALPSGRKLRYEDVKCQTKIIADPETGKPKRKSVFTAVIGSRRVETYGGKLTENLVQAVARDVFVEGMLRLEENGINSLFSVHDENILEVDVDLPLSQIDSVVSQCPEWMPGLPVAAEVKQVPHYLK